MAVRYPGPMARKIVKSEDEWRRELTPEQYAICREKGTERAFTGRYWDHHEDGVYLREEERELTSPRDDALHRRMSHVDDSLFALFGPLRSAPRTSLAHDIAKHAEPSHRQDLRMSEHKADSFLT